MQKDWGKFDSKNAFTLIELLIVIAIIGILSVAFLPTLRGGQSKARDSAKVALVNDLVNVVENQIVNAAVLPDSGGWTCITNWAVDPGVTLAGWLGRVPQTFPQITNAGQHLCNGNGIMYRKVSDSSYVFAVEVENASASNVEQGIGVTLGQGGPTQFPMTWVAAANPAIIDINIDTDQAAAGVGFTQNGVTTYFYLVGK